MPQVKERSLFKWQSSWVWVTVIVKPSHRGNISSPRKTSLPGPGEITVIKVCEKVCTSSPYPKLYVSLWHRKNYYKQVFSMIMCHVSITSNLEVDILSPLYRLWDWVPEKLNQLSVLTPLIEPGHKCKQLDPRAQAFKLQSVKEQWWGVDQDQQRDSADAVCLWKAWIVVPPHQKEVDSYCHCCDSSYKNILRSSWWIQVITITNFKESNMGRENQEISPPTFEELRPTHFSQAVGE